MKKYFLSLSAVLLAAIASPAAWSPQVVAEIRGVSSLDSTVRAVADACGMPELAEKAHVENMVRGFLRDTSGALDSNRTIRIADLSGEPGENDGSEILVAKLPAEDSSVLLAQLLAAFPEADEADLTAFPSGARALLDFPAPRIVCYAVPRDDDLLLLFPDQPDAVLDFPAIAAALAAIPPILPVQGIVAATLFDLESLFASDNWAELDAAGFFPPEYSAYTASACQTISWGLGFDAGVASLYARIAPKEASPYSEALKTITGPGDALVRAFRFPDALFSAADCSSPGLEAGTDPRNEAAIASALGTAFQGLPEGLSDDLARLAAEDPTIGESAFALLPPQEGNLLRAVACHQLKDAASFRQAVESFLARIVSEGGNAHGLAYGTDSFAETPVTRVTLEEPFFEGCPDELLLAWLPDRVVLSTAGDAACARALTLLAFPSPAAPALREAETFAAIFPDAPETLYTIGFGDLGDLLAAYLPFLGGAAAGTAPATCKAGFAAYADGDDIVAVFRSEVAALPAIVRQLSPLFKGSADVGEPEAAAEDGGEIAVEVETGEAPEAAEEAETLDNAEAVQASVRPDPEEIPAEAAETAEAAYEEALQAAREAAEIPESEVAAE
jgi:hypothetical protein